MKLKVALTSILLFTAVAAHADCDAQKAARNAAMNATVGVSGHCAPKNVTKDALRDNTNLDEKKSNLNNKTQNVKNTANDARNTANEVKNVVTD